LVESRGFGDLSNSVDRLVKKLLFSLGSFVESYKVLVHLERNLSERRNDHQERHKFLDIGVDSHAEFDYSLVNEDIHIGFIRVEVLHETSQLNLYIRESIQSPSGRFSQG
jgi:hypothetical protein